MYNEIKNFFKDKRTIYCFFSALICGFFTLLYYMVNNLNNHDSVYNVVGGGAGYEVTSGRWLLHILHDVDFYLGLSYRIGYIDCLAVVILVALSACVLMRMLQVKNRYFCAGGG